MLDLSCAKMGSIIRSLNTQEFRARFNIQNEETPEEKLNPFDEAISAELAAENKKQEADNRKSSKS